MTQTIFQPTLRLGAKVPIFYLPSTTGGQSGPASTRSKYNLVLAFLHTGSEAGNYLLDLAKLYPEILHNDARVIAVLDADLETAQRTAEALELPFPLLADEHGKTTARLLGGDNRAGLIAADRYGIIYFVEMAHSLAKLPSPDTTIEWLEYIEIQCPECTDGADQRWLAD